MPPNADLGDALLPRPPQRAAVHEDGPVQEHQQPHAPLLAHDAGVVNG
jgi:hypothetical protein